VISRIKIFPGAGAVGNKVLTDGIVRANSRVLEWRSGDWPSTDTILEIIGDGLEIQEAEDDRVLIFASLVFGGMC